MKVKCALRPEHTCEHTPGWVADDVPCCDRTPEPLLDRVDELCAALVDALKQLPEDTARRCASRILDELDVDGMGGCRLCCS